MTHYGDPLSNEEAVALCFPTSTRSDWHKLVFLARCVLKQLEGAGELRLVKGRVLPPQKLPLEGTGKAVEAGVV